MSDGSLAPPRAPLRDLRAPESAIVDRMAGSGPFASRVRAALPHAKVAEMPDGGMGGLRFGDAPGREFGRQVAEASFTDAYGVPVSVTLNIDRFGDVFELDVFKADGSPLLRFPPADDITLQS